MNSEQQLRNQRQLQLQRLQQAQQQQQQAQQQQIQTAIKRKAVDSSMNQLQLPLFSPYSSSTTPQILFLKSQLGLSLMRVDPDYSYQEIEVDPAGQDELPKIVYRQMTELRIVDPSFTEAEFLRFWRTLILKRAQDVFEKVTYRRADNYIRIGLQMLVPAPLADILYSMGSHQNQFTGMWYFMVPPKCPQENPADWWTLDATIQDRWSRTMHALKRIYTMHEFPLPSDFDDRSVFYCRRKVVNDLVSVKTKMNTIKPSDGFIVGVHDQFFQPIYEWGDMHINVFADQSLPSLRSGYISSYVLDSNT